MSTFHLTTETISIIIKEPPTVDECETNLHTHQVGLRVFQEPSKVGILIYQMNIFTIAFQTQSVPITTNVVSSNPAHGEVYSIQHYVIKFVNDLW
jgi:hypothetical protein